ncbi:hypothetical protein ON064_09350 [Planococcus sp. A6]|uniref:hypothetical protein n=1 Tax=Planococcus sp. A6 TaxID=2992760 RepID=UPI00237A4558|nr:hypothetical protein [Planococcus sp. A6]MDE0583241.1 hypothetical protein [Planococcus sp. A6]
MKRTDIDNETKIAEKLKFWEEQDQINNEVIPRVIKNHEMITDLTFQFEKKLKLIASLQDDIEKLHGNINDLTEFKSQTDIRINYLNKEVSEYEKLKTTVYKQEKQIEEMKKTLIEKEQSPRVTEKRAFNFLISIGVLFAIALSIIGIYF